MERSSLVTFEVQFQSQKAAAYCMHVGCRQRGRALKSHLCKRIQTCSFKTCRARFDVSDIRCSHISQIELITLPDWHFLNKFRVLFRGRQIKVGSVNQQISYPVAVFFFLRLCLCLTLQQICCAMVNTLMSREKHVDNQQNDTYYILYQFCGALSM